MVDVPAWFIIDLLSLACISLLLIAYRVRIAARTQQKRFIVYMLFYLGILFVGHMVGQLSTPQFLLPGYVGNFVALSLDVGILELWQAYCEVWANADEGVSHHAASPWLWAQRIFVSVNIVLNVVGLFTGWFFYYDAAGAYQRGPLFIPHVALTMLFSLVTEAYIVHHRDRIPSQAVPWLAIFPLMPFLGGSLQVLFTGLPLEFAGSLLSVSLLHTFVQERDANTDFLTGAANRRQLDIVLDAQVSRATAEHSFSGMMVDIDSFKQINDTYGHNQGDTALTEVAELLARNFSGDDLVARYGGDEFFVVSSIDDASELAQAEQRLRASLDKLNSSGHLDFKLGFSLGAGVFDPANDIDAAGFRRRLDAILYAEKRIKHGDDATGQFARVA